MATQKIELEIINVGTPVFTKTARGGYNSMEVAFKNLSFEGKVEGKKLVDFNDKAVFEAFKGFKNGEKVTVTKEKGEADQFWKWVAVSAGGTAAGSGPVGDVSAPQSGGSNSGGGTNRVIGDKRDFETSAERSERRNFDKQKHRQIGRQGCLNTAVNILGPNLHTSKSPVLDVVKVAKQLEEYVFYTTENPVAEMDSDIPV